MIADQVSAITALAQEQASAADPGAAFFVYFAESVAMSQGQKLLVDALEAHGGSDDEAPSWVNHDLDAENSGDHLRWAAATSRQPGR